MQQSWPEQHNKTSMIWFQICSNFRSVINNRCNKIPSHIPLDKGVGLKGGATPSTPCLYFDLQITSIEKYEKTRPIISCKKLQIMSRITCSVHLAGPLKHSKKPVYVNEIHWVAKGFFLKVKSVIQNSTKNFLSWSVSKIKQRLVIWD